MIFRKFTVFFMLFGVSLFGPPAAAQQSECVLDSWETFLRAEPQTVVEYEEIETDAGVVYGIKYDALSGEYGKVYAFLLDGEKCFARAVTLGSYASTNAYATESGQLDAGERLYHLDLYLPGEHSTLGFFTDAPSYEEIRTQALEVLQ